MLLYLNALKSSDYIQKHGSKIRHSFMIGLCQR